MSGFRSTKRYDLLTASPLIAINAFGVLGFLEQIVAGFRRAWPFVDLPAAMNLLSLLAVIAFVVLQIAFLITRKVPQRFSENLLSRATALSGANAGLIMLLLPHANVTVTMQLASDSLMFVGAAASAYVTIWLGRAFSIFPQARQLTTQGPYKFVRHPLYLSETVTTLGLMLQYRQPWAFLLAIGIVALQFPRMVYEERVLNLAFPDYRNYAMRTARFLPGIY